MVTWCKRHPIQFMALYLVFYLSFFTLLERSIVPTVIFHCALDDMIPFVKYAIIPYYLWFGWIVCTLFWLLWFAPKREFWRLCLPLFAGMTLSLMFCAIVPNGVSLRPAAIEGTDIFSTLVRGLWSADTSTNVCPSIHVFNSVTLDMAFQRSTLLAKPKYRLVRWGAHLLDVSIVLSTMLLKQHSVIDVVCGIVLAIVLDRAATAVSVMLERRPAVLAPAAEQPHAALEHE
ncbi:MAG TPA: hypothetical protein H9860_10660 [Candidatus Gemmiger faecavium]|nr:hypothetical protein [Candidatus Gemmiger faecavium]